MEPNQSEILLYFIGDPEISVFRGFKVLGETYDFTTKKIAIPDQIFDNWNNRKIIDFELIVKKEKKDIKIKKNNFSYKIYIYFGENKIYLFIDQISDASFDICCLDKKINISYENQELNEFTNLVNDTRSRIILINVPTNVLINKIKKLYLYQPDEPAQSNSFQIAFFDSNHNSYSVKAISPDEINDEFTLVNYLRVKKNILDNFYNDLTDLMKKNQYDVELVQNILGPIDLKRVTNNFPRRKDKFSEAFKEDELYDLYFKYFLWEISDTIHFPLTEDEKESKSLYNIECDIPYEDIFKYITKFYETYKNDQKLLNYQRILLFYSNSVFFIKINDVNKYINSELEYIRSDEIENNSVFKLSFDFLKKFIKNLTSTSELFYPLLLLDCGLYYTNNKTSYGFDFQSCEKIKLHLEDLIPDVFFIYKLDSLNDEKGFNYKGMKTVFLNKFTVLENYKGNPKKTDFNTKVVKHYAMRSSKLFSHECFGHNKFLYEQKGIIESPRHFYNKKKRFITMLPKVTKNEYGPREDNFYIDENKFLGESGNFLEYFFGFYNEQLIINLLYNISDVGKLIDNVNYFTMESLDTLKDYIVKKYKLTVNNIKYDEKENTKIKEDVIAMDELLKKNNIIDIEKPIPTKTTKVDNQKKDHPSNSIFVEINENEVKTFTYYYKKMNEAKTKEENRKYAIGLFKFRKKK